MSSLTTPVGRTRLNGVVRAEWIKLASLRSTRWALMLAAGLTIAMSVLMTVVLSFAPPEDGLDLETFVLATYGDRPALGAMAQAYLTAQPLVAILAALIVSTDRASAALRSTIAAVPRRRLVVIAKLAVTAASALVIGLVVGAAAYAVASPTFGGIGSPIALHHPVAMTVIVGGSIGLALVAVIASSLAFLFRTTAIAVGAALVLLFLLPNLVRIVPVVGPLVADLLPTTLASGLLAPTDSVGWIQPSIALLGLLAWALVAAAIATRHLQRTDI